MSLFVNIIIMIFISLISFLFLVINWKETSKDISSPTNFNHPLVKEHDQLLNLVNQQRDKLSQLIQEPHLQKRVPQYPDSLLKEEPQQIVKSSNLRRPPASSSSSSLPGAKEHKILTLSDEEFDHTRVSEMMSWYSDSQTISGQGFNCPSDFGNALVNRWRETKKTYCASTVSYDSQVFGSSSSEPIQSSIDCYPVKQTRHHGGGDNLCHLKDISMNVGLFGQDRVVDPVIQRYVDTIHEVLPYVHYPKGFVRSTCQPVASNWIKETLPGWNYDLVMAALESSPPSSDQKAVSQAYQCKEWIEHNVLIVQRDTFANFFHDSEDFVNVFLALAILEWKRSDTQLVLTDLYPKGPFWDMWSRIYTPFQASPQQEVLTAWDFRTKYGSDPNSRICFRNAAVGIYGPAAPITVASWNTPCHRTALIRAYSDFVIRGLGLQGETHYAKETPEKTITITYLARRAYSEWPEKRFCNDTSSFFKCRYWAHMGGRTIGRIIRNDADLVAGLRALETEKPGGRDVRITDVDFNKLDFENQIKIDLKTDILIGAHGAGLMHNLFLRDRGILMEIHVDGSGGNRHFHNLAHWYGRDYREVTCRNPVNVEEIVQKVRDAIASINLDSY